MRKFLKASGTAELHSKMERELQRSDRGDSVFDTLIDVLEETRRCRWNTLRISSATSFARALQTSRPGKSLRRWMN